MICSFHRKAVLLLTVVLAAGLFISVPAQGSESSDAHKSIHLLVRVEDFAGQNWSDELSKALREVDSHLGGALDEAKELWERMLRIEVPERLKNRVMSSLSALPFVRYVEEDVEAKIFAVPNDPRLQDQWYLDSVSAHSAWDVTRGSSDVVIAIIDTGIDMNHPEFAGRVVSPYDFYNGDNDPSDDNGHGTHVAGIAAATGNNGIGIAGIDWNAKIMPIKALGAKGTGDISVIMTAIMWAADEGADVINMSFGASGHIRSMQEAVDYAASKGAVLVAASGNESTAVACPANCNNVIAVGSVDGSDSVSNFSNYGMDLDVVAPGESMLSTYPGGYRYLQGTSMASPVVAGVASLVKSTKPELNPRQIAETIKETATDLGSSGFDIYYGHGKVNANAAVRAESPDPNPDPKPHPDPYPDIPDTGSTSWYFAEGYTGHGFDTFYLVFNPCSSNADVEVRFIDESGTVKTFNRSLAPKERMTIHMNGYAHDSDVSVRVLSNNGVGLSAERSMYFNYHGIDGGHCSAGSIYLSEQWFFAEGYTGHGFDQYILLLNPWNDFNSVELQLVPEDGAGKSYWYNLQPLSRKTIKVNDLMPDKSVSASVYSEYGIVAERSMYFDYGGIRDGSNAIGATDLKERWFFAEGYTGQGFDEWILMANMTDYEMDANVSFITEAGISAAEVFSLPPKSRVSIKVNDHLPNADVSVLINAEDGIIAERAMYFNYMNKWRGGHVNNGFDSAQPVWVFAEGYTSPAFDTWVLLSNPESETARGKLYLFSKGEKYAEIDFEISPFTRRSYNMSHYVSGEVSAQIVCSEGAIIAEMSQYYEFSNGDGGSSQTGFGGIRSVVNPSFGKKEPAF